MSAERAPDLREGFAADELTVAYQPIVTLPGRAPGRYEALLRWSSPAGGDIAPAAFLPLVEQAGLAQDLGRFVLTQAIGALGERAGIGVSVNVGAHELTDRTLPAAVATLLDEHDVAASAITFEITETALIRCGGVGWRILSQLAELGVRISLDDFGIGFSQLSYLMQFDFDELKIDRSFVSRILDDRAARVIVTHVVRMAGDLGLETVAEGIETPAQCAALGDLGATHGQGYLFGAAGALA